MYERITPPSVGERITSKDGEPVVPDNPIVPYIRGDGTGTDIWPAAQRFLLRPQRGISPAQLPSHLEFFEFVHHARNRFLRFKRGALQSRNPRSLRS